MPHLLHSMRNSNSHLTRWSLFLQPYDFAVEYWLEKENETVSRQAWEDTIVRAQEKEGGVSGKLP